MNFTLKTSTQRSPMTWGPRLWTWFEHGVVFIAYKVCTCAYANNPGILSMGRYQSMYILYLYPTQCKAVSQADWSPQQDLLCDNFLQPSFSVSLSPWTQLPCLIICQYSLVEPISTFVLSNLEFGTGPQDWLIACWISLMLFYYREHYLEDLLLISPELFLFLCLWSSFLLFFCIL